MIYLSRLASSFVLTFIILSLRLSPSLPPSLIGVLSPSKPIEVPT